MLQLHFCSVSFCRFHYQYNYFHMMCHLDIALNASSATAKMCGSISPMDWPLQAEMMSGPYRGSCWYGLIATSTIPTAKNANKNIAVTNVHKICTYHTSLACKQTLTGVGIGKPRGEECLLLPPIPTTKGACLQAYLSH